MAETSKVVDMTAAASVNVTDLLYLIQNDEDDRKLTIATLLGNLPNTIAKLGGLLVLGGTPQLLVNSGVITTAQTITVLSNDGTAAITINDGTYVGQLKVVLFTGGSETATLSANISVTSIAFSSPGHSTVLIWYGSAWWPIGGTATITV